MGPWLEPVLALLLRIQAAQLLREAPPDAFTTEEQAFLAASAEILCDRFNLPTPDWVHEQRYHLAKYWVAFNWIPDPDELGERLAEADPIYLRHGVVARSWDLLVA